MTLHQLKVFLTVVELGSFSRAGESLHISQPAISTQVRCLEEELGTVLLERSKENYTKLTKSGRLIYKKAKLVFKSIDHMSMEIKQETKPSSPTLKIGASHSFGSYLLPSIVTRFMKTHPDCRILIETKSCADILADMDNLDLGLLILTSTNGLEVDFVHQEEMAFVVPPSHSPQARSPSPSLHELLEMPLILPPCSCLPRKFAEEFLKCQQVSPHVVLEAGASEIVKLAVQSGIGGAFVYHSAVQAELAAGLICQVPLQEKIFIPFSVVHKRKQSPSLLQEEFVSFLQKSIAQTG